MDNIEQMTDNKQREAVVPALIGDGLLREGVLSESLPKGFEMIHSNAYLSAIVLFTKREDWKLFSETSSSI